MNPVSRTASPRGLQRVPPVLPATPPPRPLLIARHRITSNKSTIKTEVRGIQCSALFAVPSLPRRVRSTANSWRTRNSHFIPKWSATSPECVFLLSRINGTGANSVCLDLWRLMATASLARGPTAPRPLRRPRDHPPRQRRKARALEILRDAGCRWAAGAEGAEGV